MDPKDFWVFIESSLPNALLEPSGPAPAPFEGLCKGTGSGRLGLPLAWRMVGERNAEPSEAAGAERPS